MSSSATSISAPAAVTRQRLFNLQLLAQVPIVGIQEGSSTVRVSKEEGRAPAAAGDASAAASSSAAAAASPSSASSSLDDPLAQLSLHNFRVSSAFLCNTCNTAFELSEELRAHARTAWHVHNVRVQSRAPAAPSSSTNATTARFDSERPGILTEVEFEALQLSNAASKRTAGGASAASSSTGAAGGAADEEDSASSGSDSSDADASSGSKSKRTATTIDEDNLDVIGSSRITFFTPSQRLTVWKSMLLPPGAPPAHWPLGMKSSAYISSLRELPKVKNVAIVMVSGGRFSAGVWSADSLLVSKSFQRYTTRRKQGGSQSAHDAAKGAAQSIGSSIRRNETVRFWQETGRILSEWTDKVSQCQRIFIFAPGANKVQLFRAAPSVLDKNDPRLRSIPFPTHRPTLAELTRIHSWVCTVEFEERIDPPRDLEAAVEKQEASAAAAAPSSSTKGIKKAAAASAASASAPTAAPVSDLASLPEPVLDDALLNAVRCGDLDTAKQLVSDGYERPIRAGHARFRPLIYEAVLHSHTDLAQWLLEAGPAASSQPLEGEGVNEQVLDVSEDPRADRIVCWSSLHVACTKGNEAMILLLLNHGADPTAKDSRGRVPFNLLSPSHSGARLAARRLAGSSPEMMAAWDWQGKAELPPLTPEAEQLADEARRAKAREKKKAAKERAKEREKEEKLEAAAAAARAEEEARAAQQAQAIKASALAVREASVARAQAQSSLSEREKRAAAAERRLGAAKGTGPACALCALPIVKAPFERLEYKYCSIACLQQHKLQLDAQEAGKGSSAAAGSKTVAFNPR